MAHTKKKSGRPTGTTKPDSLRQAGVHFTIRVARAELVKYRKLAVKRKTSLAKVIRAKLAEWADE